MNEEEEYLVSCTVDVYTKKFFLHSDRGTEKVVDCDNIDQFLTLLSVVREFLKEDMIEYNEH